jgi:hypothetical protein
MRVWPCLRSIDWPILRTTVATTGTAIAMIAQRPTIFQNTRLHYPLRPHPTTDHDAAPGER